VHSLTGQSISTIFGHSQLLETKADDDNKYLIDGCDKTRQKPITALDYFCLDKI
jgi:hypothetical protein